MKYNKDNTIGEILQDNSKNAEILLGFGMHCLGCPMSRRETIEQACEVHELDLNFVLSKLNEQVEAETNSEANSDANSKNSETEAISTGKRLKVKSGQVKKETTLKKKQN